MPAVPAAELAPLGEAPVAGRTQVVAAVPLSAVEAAWQRASAAVGRRCSTSGRRR